MCDWSFGMYIIKKRDVLFLSCQIPEFIGYNKSSIKFEDLKDRKLF